jgi:hypothetical protein
MKRPYIDVVVDRLEKLDNRQCHAFFNASIKRSYQHNSLKNFEISQIEKHLIESILRYGDKVYLEPNKKIYRRKLFNRIKKKFKNYPQHELSLRPNEYAEFTTSVSQEFKVFTSISIDTMCYDYYQDVYQNDCRIRFLANYPSLIGIYSYGWAIYNEEDIETVLQVILDCCQQFIAKITDLICCDRPSL